MVNRSALVIGHEPAFYGWLKTTGVPDSAVTDRREIAERTVYLVPACHFPEEIEEVVADLFAEIFRRELSSWQRDETLWPDTADIDLFDRWFTVEGVSLVDDIGHGSMLTERGPAVPSRVT